MAYAQLKTDIAAVIRNNGNQEITGNVLQGALLEMINALGANYQYAGVADTSTTITTTEANVFYLLTEAGTYSNMSSSIVHTSGIGIALWNGSAWSYQNVPTAAVIQTDATPTVNSTTPVQSGGVIEYFQDVEVVGSNNLFNRNAKVVGSYYWIYGPATNSSYMYSNLIEVEEGKTYSFQNTVSQVRAIRSMPYIVAFDENQQILSSQSKTNVSTYSVPVGSGIKYVIFSITNAQNNYTSFVEGTELLPWEDYVEPHTEIGAIKEELIPLDYIREEILPPVEIDLPDKIYAVVGDTLQVFFNGCILAPDPLIYDIETICTKGSVFRRYWEYTPEATDVGTTTLTIVVKDKDRKVIGQKQCWLITNATPTSPSSTKKIMCVGDSLTAGGQWPSEAYRRLTGTGGTPSGLGLTNVSFVGSMTLNGAGYVGKSGWNINDFLTSTSTNNPFYDSVNNKFSFKPYVDTYCGGSIDIACILLSYNGLSTYKNAEIKTQIETFINTLHSEYPSCKVELMNVCYPSMKLRMPSYGANSTASVVTTYADTFAVLKRVASINALYQGIANDSDYSAFVEFVNTSSQVDSEYNYPITEKSVNTRNSTYTEPYANNGVHPANAGYYQIADVIYRNLCNELQ